jgi:hydroxypyruvate isomerase
MNFCLCVETFFAGDPLDSRLEKIAGHGWDWIEFWASGDKDHAELQAALQKNRLRVANFSGQREGTSYLSADRAAYTSEIEANMNLAQVLGCERLMLLTDPLAENGHVTETHSETPALEKIDATVATLRELAPLAEKNKITLVLEPLNTTVDHPGYFLASSEVGFEIIRRVDHPRIKLLFDGYHLRAMGEDVVKSATENLPLIGHVHLADEPGRHEPGTGTFPFREFLGVLKDGGYSGFVGFELFPEKDDESALKAISDLLPA